jgi:ApbE superfamily uncharacterized protein (UPF0280 family)
MMEGDRFTSFQVTHFETDLWIGVDPYSYHISMHDFVLKKIREIRASLEQYIAIYPAFKHSLTPLPDDTKASHYVQSMIHATQKSGTGPFSSVAGMFAQEIGMALIDTYRVNEVIVENGGDLFLYIKNDLEVAIYAGNSPLSNKIAVVLPASESPVGLCTSSATVGPSLSLGNTDATMIACSDASLADAFATRFGNMVKSAADINGALADSELFPEIKSILIIIGDQFGVKGKFPIKPIG